MPSNAALEQKQALVAGLSDRMKASVAGVIVNYTGISVADAHPRHLLEWVLAAQA